MCSSDLGEADWTGITITTGQMQPGNEMVVADRILKFLPLPRNPRSSTLLAPQTLIQGRWEVDMEFFNSSSQHQWVLEQEGSWIQGYHKGDFSTREIMGTLEGDQLRLQSVDQHPADHLPYIFTGTVSNDQLSGKVDRKSTRLNSSH